MEKAGAVVSDTLNGVCIVYEHRIYQPFCHSFPQIQAPSDFMDEEDTGEFGIAPHRIQTTAEFTDDRSTMKRARISLQSDGPISGDPVKNLFIEPVKGKIAVNLLRRMGWKDEAGKPTCKQFTHTHNSHLKLISSAFRSCLTGNSEKTASASKVYHCDMGPIVQPTGNDDYDSDEDMDVSRRILSSGIVVFKSNRFGLGYVGLTKYHIAEPQQHINLFAQLEVADRMSKKVPIKGQAFGVGAFEEDDDDIYARDTMSNYDFSMAKEPKDKRRPASLTTKRSSDFPGEWHISSVESNNFLLPVCLVAIRLRQKEDCRSCDEKNVLHRFAARFYIRKLDDSKNSFWTDNAIG